MTVMTGALYPQRPGALSRGAYSFRNGGWADLATALGMGILSADGQNVTLPQNIAAGLQNFQQTSRDRQQEQRQAWLDQMTQQQFDLTKSETEARAQDRKDEKARKERTRALLMGGPAMPIDQGGPAAGQFMKPGSPGLAGDLGIPDVLARALAEEGDPTAFATLFGQKATRDEQARRDAANMAWDREKFDKQYALDVKQLGVSAANAAASRRIQEAELALKQRELEGRGGVGDLFGKGDEMNVIVALAPLIENGTATADQIRQYHGAIAKFQRPFQVHIPDPNNPGAMMLGTYAPPLPQVFPAPGSSGATPTQGAGASSGVTPIPGTEKPFVPTETQAKSALFARRADQAFQILSDPKIAAALSDLGQNFANNNLPDWAAGAATAPEFKQGWAAAQEAVNALNRRDSGAAVPDSEVINAIKRYIPQPWDDEGTKAQKRAAMATAIEGLKIEAGPAYKPPKAGQTTSSDFADKVKTMSSDAIRAMDVDALSAEDAQAVLGEIQRRKQSGAW